MAKWMCSLVQSLAEPLVTGCKETEVQGSALPINLTTIDVDRARRYPYLSDFVVRLWPALLSVSVLQSAKRTEKNHMHLSVDDVKSDQAVEQEEREIRQETISIFLMAVFFRLYRGQPNIARLSYTFSSFLLHRATMPLSPPEIKEARLRRM